MTDAQLSSALQRIYDEEKHRIVFWYDHMGYNKVDTTP
jgi:hypothetical protein